MELTLELTTKICSCCKEFKSAGEFYKQGVRHESLCKNCKKNSRKKREKPVETDSSKVKKEKIYQTASIFKQARQESSLSKNYDRETVRQFDESVFYPEERRRALGISDDEMDSIVAYFRWQMDQLEKNNKRKEEGNL